MIRFNIDLTFQTARSHEADCVTLAERALKLVYALINKAAGDKVEITPQLQYDIDLNLQSQVLRIWKISLCGSQLIKLSKIYPTTAEKKLS